MTITNNQPTNFLIARFIKREHDEISIILVSNNATKTLEITIENQSPGPGPELSTETRMSKLLSSGVSLLSSDSQWFSSCLTIGVNS